MPKMSDTMTEGVIASWLKQVGDKVKSGDVLAEVETDKATMELESYEDGTLLYIGPKKGDAVPVDALIAVIGKEGEDISAIVNGGGAQAAAPKQDAQPAAAAAPAPKPAATAAPAQGGSQWRSFSAKSRPAKPAANIKAS